MEQPEVQDTEMTDAELTQALEKLGRLTQVEEGKMTFDDAAFDNDREEYLNNVIRRRGPSPTQLPCKRVVLTKALGTDGRVHSLQVVNPVKQVLKEERARKRRARKQK